MKYSIIVPVHNVETYISQCVKSVLKQSYEGYEMILVDDGSSDMSGIICDQLTSEDKRVTVVHQPCQGVSAARNAGIDIAKGEYIIFLDSDDYWTSENALAAIDKGTKDADVVRFDYKIVIDGDNDSAIAPIQSTKLTVGQYYSGKDFLVRSLSVNPEFPWYSVMYAFKKSLWEEPEKLRYPVGIRFHEDSAVIYKALLRAKAVNVIDKCVYVYRKRADAVSREDSAELLINRVSVNQDQINFIERNNGIEEPLKSLLCRNMSTSFYTDLIHVGALDTKEQNEVLEYLKQVQKQFTKYPATSKQETVNKMLRIFGMRNTCKILHFRRIVKYRNLLKR